MYQHWTNLKDSPDYNEEAFLNDIIDNKITELTTIDKLTKQNKL